MGQDFYLILTALRCYQPINILANLILLFVKIKKEKGYILIMDVLPDILIDFASNSHSETGERLMQKCVRHALDSRYSLLTDATSEKV